MSHIQGIKVDLQILASEDGGSKDRLYLGVVGTAGGREFPLYNHHFDESTHKPGTAWMYRLGEIWDEVPPRVVPLSRASRFSRTFPSTTN